MVDFYTVTGCFLYFHRFPGTLSLCQAGIYLSRRKRLARTVLIFTEKSDQLSRATDRVPGLPASPGYAQ
ncbi:hypothetical protein B8017_30140 [Klebsiella pneumoniae]|nr:hypothetical protein AM360_28725 [Klebsiella pneumoniae]ASB10184.1 hypothetical protein AM372_00900 [Klebsiella pneumoniae]OUR29193.1 hypothetical protein B5L84_01920 [Klebsiella pneumoniae]OVF31377.1 hypothetical protein B8Z94_04355 [Klebsiella pneumoniae]OVF55724.1 hypothetical protein B8Z96_05240 [Klebsiella pneumoniae]